MILNCKKCLHRWSTRKVDLETGKETKPDACPNCGDRNYEEPRKRPQRAGKGAKG